MQKSAEVDAYIAQYPEDIQKVLQALRIILQEALPEAQERISWAMPTFYLKGNVAHFAACQNHVGFYPGSGAIAAFQDQIAAYKSSKGSVQFPYTKELPKDLIQAMAKHSLAENQNK